MTATNHAVTGAFVGIAIANPIAIPIAFLSHFLLDALPHFGLHSRKNAFKIYLFIDAILVSILIAIVSTSSIANIPIVLAAMFAAVLPDAVWAFRWYKEANKGADPNEFHDPLTKFHSRIQWFERPIGLLTEIIWFLLMVYLIYVFV